MKVTLISMEHLIISYGLRSISSVLKKNGFDVSIIFIRALPGEENLSNEIINDTIDLCKDSDVIGISVMTNYFLQSKDLTIRLKEKIEAPIIWGGIHPTFSPEECLEYADMVCIGEGEESVLELVKKIETNEDYFNTEGLFFKNGKGEILKNNIKPLVTDLDSYPNPDYDINNHFVRDGNAIVKLDEELFEKVLPKRIIKGKVLTEYYITTARGCPFSCSYCASSSFRELYKGEEYFRHRSIESVISEVESLIQRYPFIKFIYLCTDDIFAGSKNRIKKFGEQWKKRIGLPFLCTCSPNSYNEEKMTFLVEAGLAAIGMGVQSVSSNGSEVFNRKIPKSKILKVASSIIQFKNIEPPKYDFIIDNPYENEEDELENLKFILDLPTPKGINLFSLVPFFGTPIYERFRNDGLIEGDSNSIHQKPYCVFKAKYINFLFKLASFGFPSLFIRILYSRPILTIFNRKKANWLIPIFESTIPVLQGLVLLMHLDFKRIRYYLNMRGFYKK